MAICTYHKKNDTKEISEYVTSLGNKNNLTDGVIFRKNNLIKSYYELDDRIHTNLY